MLSVLLCALIWPKLKGLLILIIYHLNIDHYSDIKTSCKKISAPYPQANISAPLGLKGAYFWERCYVSFYWLLINRHDILRTFIVNDSNLSKGKLNTFIYTVHCSKYDKNTTWLKLLFCGSCIDTIFQWLLIQNRFLSSLLSLKDIKMIPW